MVFRRKLAFLKQVAKKKQSDPKVVLEMALTFSIIHVTPHGLKLRKHVNVMRGIEKNLGSQEFEKF